MVELYNRFYALAEAPFNITPDPRFLFLSEKHREAFDHLVFGIQQRKGFIQLTGEVGSGKTTLCRALLEKLDREQYRTALILNPCLSETQLIRGIAREFGIDPVPQDRAECLDALNRFLLEQVTAGRDVVLIIDEAQDLTIELLEQVRLLSNLETDQRKLLQIVLIGQPELRDTLNDPRLRQLRQRITVRYHLNPLTRDETERYIRHRLDLSRANGRSDLSFTRGALRWIYRYSRGVPRLVNAVCDKTLLCGYVAGTGRIAGRHVRRAIRDLEGAA